MNNYEYERLKLIRERARETPHYFTADFHFLLSLLESQAAGNDFETWWDDYQRPWLPNGIAGYEHAKLAWSAAATRMRERCVARVKQLLPEYEKLDHAPPSNALREAIAALESLTLGRGEGTMNEKDKDTAGTLIYKLNKERKGHHVGDCAGEACPDWLTRQVDMIGNALSTVRREARAAAFKDAVEIIDTAADGWGDLARARKSKTFSAYVIAALDLKGQLNQAAANSVKDSEQDA